MALPGKYKKKINLTRDRQNTEYTENFRMESAAAENMKDMIIDKDAYLPRGVMHIDLDAGFKEFVTDTMALTLNGERVPVFMMGIQKWNEFSKTWKFSDEYKNVKIPFVNIVRQPDTKPGSNPALIYNVPQGKNYTYAEVPTWDGNRKGYDIYKIPQPVSVDIMYEVRLFCNRMRDLNVMNRKMLTAFSPLERYIRVNGHPIPLIMDSIGDESTISNLEERKYYVQLYTIKMMGYLLDEDDFVVTPAVSRGINFYEISENIYKASYQLNVDDKNNTICINIVFNSGVSSVTIPMNLGATFTIANATNYSSLIFKVNGNTVNIPFTVNNGDQLYIKVFKNNIQGVSEVELNGITL